MDYKNSCLQIIKSIKYTSYYMIKDLKSFIRGNLKTSYINIFTCTVNRLYHYNNYLFEIMNDKNNDPYYVQQRLIIGKINYFTLWLCLRKIQESFINPILHLDTKNFQNIKVLEHKILIGFNQLNFLIDQIHQAIIYPRNELFGIPFEERYKFDRWINLQKNIKYIETGAREEVYKQLNKINKRFFAISASFFVQRNKAIKLKRQEDILLLEKQVARQKTKKDFEGVPQGQLSTQIFKNFFKFYNLGEVIQKDNHK